METKNKSGRLRTGLLLFSSCTEEHSRLNMMNSRRLSLPFHLFSLQDDVVFNKGCLPFAHPARLWRTRIQYSKNYKRAVLTTQISFDRQSLSKSESTSSFSHAFATPALNPGLFQALDQTRKMLTHSVLQMLSMSEFDRLAFIHSRCGKWKEDKAPHCNPLMGTTYEAAPPPVQSAAG